MAAESHTVGTWPRPLLDETIGDNFARAVSLFGDRDALVERQSGRRWTYRELADEVDELARGLLEAGISPGDRVGIWAPNCGEWVIVQYACAVIGAIMVNLNPAYGTHEIEYVLNLAGVRLVIAAPRYKTSDYAAMLDEVRPRCPGLERVVLLGGPCWASLRQRGLHAPRERLAAVRAGLRPDDAVNIQFTSGTTGFPKGATLSHRNILNNGYFVGEVLGYTEADRVCVAVPLFHCFGMVMGNLAATTHGACIVLPSPTFDARATLSAVAEERCTSLYGVPTMFIAELADPDFDAFDLTSLRTGIMSGAPCPVEVMRQVVDRMGMTGVTICYGMTETSPVATQTRFDDPLKRRVSTVGRAGPHVEVSVVEAGTNRPVRRGDSGEVCIRGYSVMLGYWDQPDRTAESIDADGWMHTGDIGTMDDDGYVNITGRLKEMVIRGGECMFPREIEEFLHTHPDILDVQVVGVPDHRYGEDLMAWVRMRHGVTPLRIDGLRRYCTGRIAHHKIPRYLQVVDEPFPMTVSGKVRKVELRERGIELLGLRELLDTRHA